MMLKDLRVLKICRNLLNNEMDVKVTVKDKDKDNDKLRKPYSTSLIYILTDNISYELFCSI